MPYLFVLGCLGLVASFNQRMLDPLTPLIAREIGVATDLVVMLAPAFTLPYALGQPFLGPIGDSFGKALVLKIALLVLVIATGLTAIAPSYEILFALRVVTGIAAGAIIPTSLAIIGDRYPLEQRQVALSRFMIALIVGQLFSGPISAYLAQLSNWHAVPTFAAVLGLMGFVLTSIKIKPRVDAVRPKLSLSGSIATYRAILSNPVARACYFAVFAEGILVFGFTPHIALYLQGRNLGSVTEAGYIMAGLGLGGVIFAFVVKQLVQRFNPYSIMQTGGIVMGGGLAVVPFCPTWPMIVVAFGVLGFGFYMLHSGLQVQTTEVMPEARASAVSLHAFFLFLGIAAGPVVMGFLVASIGFASALVINGLSMLVVSWLAIHILAKSSGRMRDQEIHP